MTGLCTSQRQIDTEAATAAVRGLQSYRMEIVWSDFILSWIIAVLGMLLTAFSPTVWLVPVAYLIAVLALYRAVMFSHEIVHMGSRCPAVFWWTWNGLCGAPSMMPSFFIETHLHHHNTQKYATVEDPEYSPYGLESPNLFLKYILSAPVTVALLFVRHLFLVPVSWVLPSVRQWVFRKASAGAIHTDYVREGETLGARNKVVEFMCFVWFFTVVLATATGAVPVSLVIAYFATALGAFLINSIRTVVSHRFAASGPITWESQVMDSINLDGPDILNEILAPVGMRYHATHHMFPKVPYHNLGEAHRRLMAALGPDSPYASLSEPNLLSALIDLWRRSSGQKAAVKIA